MASFNVNLETVSNELQCRKDSLKRLLLSSGFQKDVDYINIGTYTRQSSEKRGGRNKETIMLTNTCVEQLRLRHLMRNRKEIVCCDVLHIKRYVPKEIEVLDFIQESLKDIVTITRQYRVCGYRIDLYIVEKNIAVECDENGHKHYNSNHEQKRQKEIESRLHCTFVRFNPDDVNFKLAVLVNSLLKMCIVTTVTL
jgi:very-short-patch-repair endonuclease